MKWTEEEMKEKMNLIHNMDCLSFMKQVPDNYFDLVLTDPPYGIGIAKTGTVGGGGLASVKIMGLKSGIVISQAENFLMR